MATLAEIADAANQLSPDEQRTLIEILKRRLADGKRGRLVTAVAEARAEFASGTAQLSSVKQIMDEVADGPT